MRDITVKSINVSEVKEELKSCSKNIQNYVEKVEQSAQAWKEISYMAIKKRKDQKEQIIQMLKDYANRDSSFCSQLQMVKAIRLIKEMK